MIRNIQNLIENIRTVILFPETVTPVQIRQYARDYAEACSELNRRMLQCSQHIREGNIAEGIRLSEMQPPLATMYVTLDFAERDEWIEIVSTLGYNIPPALPAELHKELNNAYLKMSPLEPLLRWHRLYALNGSPIRERLAVLRSIAKIDQQNSFWREDQEVFEKTRLKELEKEVQNVITTKNITQIQSLYSELSSPDWIIPPPPEYRQKLCTIILHNLSEILLKHFNAFAYNEAAVIYDKMQKLLANTNMTMPQPIQHTIRAAVLWLTETQRQKELQKKFNKLAADLNDALNAESSAPVLEQIHYALLTVATQTDTPIPIHLEERYQLQIENYELQRSRQIKILVTAVACVCIFIGGLIVWGLNMRNYNHTVSTTLAALEELENNRRYEDIPGTLQQIEQTYSIRVNPQVATAFEKLRNLYDTDQKRANEFERFYNQASQALDITPEPATQEEANEIKKPITQAEQLMRTTAEKTSLTKLKLRYETATRPLKTKLDTEYNENIKFITNNFNKLRQNEILTPDEILLQLTELFIQIDTLDKKYPDTSETLKRQNSVIRKSISDYETKIKSELEQNKIFNEIVNKISNFAEYKNALQSFVTNYKQHPAATDAEEVLKELDNIQTVTDMLRKLNISYSANAHDIKKLRENSTELLTSINELASKISDSLEQLFPPTQYLKLLAEMKPYTSETLTSTKKILESLAQKNVWRWIRKENWYYLTKKPEKLDRAGNYEYITTLVSDHKPITIYESEFKPEKVPNISQSEFSIAALKKLDAADSNAIEVVCSLIGELLRSNDIDPILKFILLDLLITDTAAIDPIFNLNFKRCIEIIATSNVDKDVNWMDVDSKNTIPQRNLATVALSRMPNINEIIEKTKQEHKNLKNIIGKFNLEFDWIGILVYENNRWQCRMKTPLTEKNGTLYILRQNSNDIIVPMVIGKSSESLIKLSENENSYLQCLPVFLKRQN
ncbi:MAG: hypothetical protein LBE18_04535 [Planctomycetaceae bacterium]|jgi:hypothetical protein|nr:hypothetical protein [Planctomycetaceae bacterium]